jgi:hypothetical protein
VLWVVAVIFDLAFGAGCPAWFIGAFIPADAGPAKPLHLAMSKPQPTWSGPPPRPLAGYVSCSRRSNCALTATMTVLSDIRMAPTAGESTIPTDARTPAASGIARML